MKKFVFVIMPFKNEFNDIYQLGIKSACREADCYCERVDEQIYDGSMIERIYNQIRCADFIIADMSEKNPNVFFEVGYAFALEKRVILITQNVEDIPFDMKDYFHIVYKRDNIFQLQKSLLHRIDFFKNFENECHVSAIPDVLINGIKLTENKTCENETNIEVKIEPKMGYDILDYNKPIIKEYNGIIDFAIYNPSDRLAVKTPHIPREIEIQFVFDNEMPFSTFGTNDFLISNNKRIYRLYFNQLLPNFWDGKKYPIEISPTQFENLKKSYDCKIAVFLERKLEYNFKCCFKVKDIKNI